MKDAIKLFGAVCAILLAGAVVGAGTVWNHVRVGMVEAQSASVINDLNQRVFPGIQTRVEALEKKAGIDPNAAAPKK